MEQVIPVTNDCTDGEVTDVDKGRGQAFLGLTDDSSPARFSCSPPPRRGVEERRRATGVGGSRARAQNRRRTTAFGKVGKGL